MTKVDLRKLYYRLLLSAYVLRFIELRINLHKSVKENYLLYDHAIRSKSETKRLLQEFAFQTNSKLFPIHRDEAIQYFTVTIYPLILLLSTFLQLV